MLVRDANERIASLERRTKEVAIEINVNIDGTGKSRINTNIPFLDHMINTFARYSKVDINLIAKSEDQIKHHLIEDVGIILGQSLNDALGKREKIY